MACKNTPCKYHDAASPNGCKIFPGVSWINCRGASVKLVAARKTATKQSKGK